MATQKISVTLESSAIERARLAAGPRGLSSYVNTALEDRLERDERRRAFLEYLDELEANDPRPPTESSNVLAGGPPRSGRPHRREQSHSCAGLRGDRSGVLYSNRRVSVGAAGSPRMAVQPVIDRDAF